MDSFDGLAQEPITLHKYLYANADPVNMVDPSGYFSLGSVSAANNIRGMLMNIQIEVGLNFLDAALNPNAQEDFVIGASVTGALVLLNFAGKHAPQLWRLFSKKARKCSNSFTAGTLVHTQEGLRAIEEINIGDKVWSFNEKNKENQWNEVVHLIQVKQSNYDLVTLIIGEAEKIEATAEHPFYVVDQGWQNVGTLATGNLLLSHNGDIEVNSISRELREIAVFNLTVANNHNYYIGKRGILVHNTQGDKICQIVTTETSGVARYISAMAGASLKTRQRAVSIPAIEKYVERLKQGSTPPPIKVDNGIIVDGNHRYIAGRIVGKEPPVVSATEPTFKKSQPIIPWEAMRYDPTDWGNR